MKNIWWIVLILSFTILLSKRLGTILDGTATHFDIVLLLVWLALALAPIFSNIELWGLKLKQELESFKGDVRHDMNNLRADIRMGIQQQIVVTTNTEMKKFDDVKHKLPTERQDGPLPTPAERGWTENKILNTLWRFQVSHSPDYTALWTFRVQSNAPSFIDFNAARAKLIDQQVVSETSEGQLFLTPLGFNYCKKYYQDFPAEHWFPEQELDPTKLETALQTDPFSPRPPRAQGEPPKES